MINNKILIKRVSPFSRASPAHVKNPLAKGYHLFQKTSHSQGRNRALWWLEKWQTPVIAGDSNNKNYNTNALYLHQLFYSTRSGIILNIYNKSCWVGESFWNSFNARYFSYLISNHASILHLSLSLSQLVPNVSGKYVFNFLN